MVFKRVVCDKIINRKSYAGGFFNRPYFCLERSTFGRHNYYWSGGNGRAIARELSLRSTQNSCS